MFTCQFEVGTYLSDIVFYAEIILKYVAISHYILLSLVKLLILVFYSIA